MEFLRFLFYCIKNINKNDNKITDYGVVSFERLQSPAWLVRHHPDGSGYGSEYNCVFVIDDCQVKGYIGTTKHSRTARATIKAFCNINGIKELKYFRRGSDAQRVHRGIL